MAARTPQLRADNCYAQVEEELKRTLTRALGDISSLPRAKSYERAQTIISDILSVTTAALSAFGHAWNDVQRDPVAVLPSELMSACFSWLDLKSCISVSHVSRVWRNAALSDRNLWSEYTVSADSRLNTYAGLRAMLLRSGPLPFRLTCAADISNQLVDSIGPHMHRVQVLCLEAVRRDAVVRLMEHDAPLLEEFSYPRSNEYYTPITFRWSTSRAPRLRKVTLETFLLPSGSVFGAIRVFCGTFPAGGTLPGTLASIFPSLLYLTLNGVTRNSLGMLATLPCSLKTVVLKSTRDSPIEYSEFLKACHAVDLSHLCISSAASISDAVGLVVRGPDSLWNLRLGHPHYLKLGTAGANYEVHCHRRISLVDEPAIIAHLHRLETLTLALFDYAALHQSKAWTRALPALAQCTLLTESPGTLDLAREVLASPPIDAPALKSICVRIDERFAYERCAPLARVVPIARSLAVPRLEELVLCLPRPTLVQPDDLACLAELAQRISVCSLDSDDVVMVLEGSLSNV